MTPICPAKESLPWSAFPPTFRTPSTRSCRRPTPNRHAPKTPRLPAPEPTKVRRRKPGLHRVSNKGRALRRARFLEAYIANGYRKGRSAYLAGYEFLKELAATGELAAVARQRGEAAGLETERTLREVARVAYADPRRLFEPDCTPIPLHELPEEVAATIASYEIWPNGRVKAKFWSKGPGPGDAPCGPVRARQHPTPAEPRHSGQFRRPSEERGSRRGMRDRSHAWDPAPFCAAHHSQTLWISAVTACSAKREGPRPDRNFRRARPFPEAPSDSILRRDCSIPPIWRASDGQ